MDLRADCRWFPGDRPCAVHKRSAVKCSDCPNYAPIGHRVLIVKLDALGDVLRSTCILGGLARAYPGTHITWLTRREAFPLFENNPYVHRLYDAESSETLAFLQVEEFDIVIGLDAARPSAALAGLARGHRWLGYFLDRRGVVVPGNAAAAAWLEMGAFDDVKRANRETYQQIVLPICELPQEPHEIVVRLSPEERAFAAAFARQHGVDGRTPRIGLNLGGGTRWQTKRWPLGHYRELIRLLLARGLDQILISGGRAEAGLVSEIIREFGDAVVNTGTENSLRQFLALLDLADVLVTPDTLAVHAAAGLGKRIVCLFGPTSDAEIDLYGRGIKLLPEEACGCYYSPTCLRVNRCMETIRPQSVLTAIQSLLELGLPGKGGCGTKGRL